MTNRQSPDTQSADTTTATEQPNDTTAGAGRNALDTDTEPPSCDSCRRRKLRCSRDLPSCAHCVRSQSRCTYDYQRKRPGLKPGALDALTRRVESLEAARDCRGQNSTDTPARDQPPATGGESRTADVMLMVVDQLRLLNSTIATTSSLDGTPPRKRRRTEHIETDDDPPRPDGDETINAVFPMLSSKDFVERLLAAYFDNVHPWIPMLHQVHDRNHLSETGGLDDESRIVLHAVFLAAHHFMQDTGPWDRTDLQYHAAQSRDLIIRLGMSTISLDNLRALTIVAYMDIATGNTSKAWSIIGSLTRTVQYLGLSVEEDAPETTQPTTLLPDLPELPRATSWIEREGRRRLFWNVFLLDRFCAITTGWKAGFTADDVARRLPADGGLWRRCQPVVTPYFGIWDHNSVKIGKTITFLPSKYGSPDEASVEDGPEVRPARHGSHRGHTQAPTTPVRSIGAFSYCIESVESLGRMNSFFLQQKIDLTDREEVSSWLTRFKELDLRLVHWKRFLPQRWKNPSDTPNPTTLATMDPNMTLAHVVHNTASIFLHQKIAYPSRELGHLRLPSACSADTCYIAASETSNIAAKYLQQDIVTKAIAPLFSISLFISAKILLVHSSYYKSPLAPEFGDLIRSLETISQNWRGHHVSGPSTTLSGNLALQLRQLHASGQSDPASPAIELFQAHAPTYKRADEVSTGISPFLPSLGEQQQQMTQAYATPTMALDDLSAGLLDPNFLMRDRIINYDDMTFNAEMYGFPDMM